MLSEPFQKILEGTSKNTLGYVDVEDLKQHAEDAGGKHDTILDYSLDIFTDHSGISEAFDCEDIDSEIDLTLCYSVWRTPLYVKYLYLSFLSQILYTDISKVDKVYIITDNYLEHIVWEVFRPFTDLDNFDLEIKNINSHTLVESHVASDILTPRRINKYIISFLEDIRETELLLLSDSESFTYGKPTNIYSKIYRQYKNENGNFPIIGCREEDEESVFLERRKNLATMIATDGEYVNWFCRRLGVSREEFIKKMIKNKDWYLTCWFLYDNEKFSIEDEKWRDFVEWCRLYGFYCDESVYLSYGRCCKDYDFEDLDYINGLKFIYSEKCKNFYRKEEYDTLGVMHPLHGEYSTDDWVTNLYDSIQFDFMVLMGDLLNEGKTLKTELPQY